MKATWPPVLRNLQSACVLQPSLVTTRSIKPVGVRTESICTRRKIPIARRFRSDSATEAESYDWPGRNSSSRRMTAGRVRMWRLLANRANQLLSLGSKMSRRWSWTPRMIRPVSALEPVSGVVWAGSWIGSRNAASGRRCRKSNRAPGEEHGAGQGKGCKIGGSLSQGSDAVEDPVRLDPALTKDGLSVFTRAYQPALQSCTLGTLDVRP